jgi:carbonic anhydrase
MTETTKENNWAYQNYMRWKNLFPNCAGSYQSPINIDTSKIAECNETCRLSVRYIPSKCHISNNNRTPILRIDPGNYIKFRGILYELTKITMHTPSMHTVNGDHYDMEMQLHHCSNASDCSAGGVIISIFLQRGTADSDANYFLSQFINKIPSEETQSEKDIKVNDDWNPELLFPNIKSFFYYNGSLPTPPCDEKWTYIIFEEVNIIDKALFENFEFTF